MSEINCPLKKSWKLRWGTPREPACQRDPRPEANSAPFDSAFSSMGILDSDTITSLDDASFPLDYYNLRAIRHRPGDFLHLPQGLCNVRHPTNFGLPRPARLRYSCSCCCLLPGDSLRK